MRNNVFIATPLITGGENLETTQKKYRIGIDLGGTNIKVGIVNEKNEIMSHRSEPTVVNRSYKEIIKTIADTVLQLLMEKHINIDECISLGIGSPGTIDNETGMILYSNNFGWENIPILAELKEYMNLPMYISNDANCAALGEAVAGAAVGCKNIVLLTLGTGIGSGIILNGKIYEGGHAGGAELGHCMLVAGGERCTCGRDGCFESYASATALIRETRIAAVKNEKSLINEISEYNIAKISGITPFLAATRGDEAGIRVVNNYIKYLSEGIINIINIFRPDKVLISGGICNQGDNLVIPVNEYVKKYCFAGDKAYIAIVERASLGNMAGMIGAASLNY